MRRYRSLLAASIPRDAWDPLRHNPKHVDSYAQHIVDRRQWPAKKWSVGLEPRTPREWLNYSPRNLAYAYNGALRACASFPEMVPLYQEMKQRKVRMDVDTMVTMLSRGARFEQISGSELFQLLDEMMQLGAKPDLVVVEIMHTVWDNTVTMSALDREARRVQMLELYDAIAQEDIAKLGPRNLPSLLQSNMARLRDNMHSLQGTFSNKTWKMYFAQIRGFNFLLLEVNNYLWGLARGQQVGATEVTALQLQVPHIDETLSRASEDAVLWDDTVVNEVLLAAVERLVDFPLTATIPQRSQLFILTSLFWRSRVFLGPRLLEQVMDVAKFSDDDKNRDKDAQTYMRYAIRAASMTPSGEVRSHWVDRVKPVSAALVGRYLAARDPWSDTKFSFEGSKFGLFPSGQLSSSSAGSGTAETTESVASSAVDDESAGLGSAAALVRASRSVKDVDVRLRDIDRLISQTKVLHEDNLQTRSEQEQSVEVFTGKLTLLRRMLTGDRYGDLDAGAGATDGSTAATSTAAAAGPFSLEIAARIFEAVRTTKYELDAHLEANKVQPELEAWESLLLVANFILDQLAVNKRSLTEHGRAQAEALFAEVVEFRGQIVGESKSRFGGRFQMLWLSEV